MSEQSPNNSDTRLLISFEEGQVVDKAAGGSTPKIITSGGIVTDADSKFGTHSLLCYGVGNSLKIGASIDWQFGTTPWVLDAWFKFIEGPRFLFGWWKDVRNFCGVSVRQRGTGQAVFFVRYHLNGRTQVFASSVAPFFSGGQWLHFALHRGDGIFGLYHKGNRATFIKFSLDLSTMRCDFQNWPLYVGRSHSSGSEVLGDMHGYVDEVKVHNGPLIKNGSPVVPLGSYDEPTSPYLTKRTILGSGAYHVYGSSTMEAAGTHLVGGTQIQISGGGEHNIYSSSQIDGVGQYNAYTASQVDGAGESAVGLVSEPQYRTSRFSNSGQHSIYNASQIDGSGQYVFLTQTVQIDGSGSHDIRVSSQVDASGTHDILRSVQIDGSGIHSVKSAADQFSLWYSKDAPPDLTTPADETFASLPFTSLAISGAGVWHFVVRKRNDFGLTSQNINAFKIELDGSDNEILERPSGPGAFAVSATGSGGATVTAEYDYTVDGHGLASGNRSASSFLIYMTSNGVDPDPAVDTPTVVSMLKADGIAKLRHVFASLGDAMTVKVLVRTRQASGRDSTDTSIKQATTSTGGPPAPVLTVTQTMANVGVKIA